MDKETRREFLMWSGMVFAGAILAGTIGFWEQIEDKFGEISTAPEFNPFPKGFDFATAYKHVIVVVHAGYSRSHFGIDTNEETYGSYNIYLKHLQDLTKYLGGQKNELSTFAVENSVYRGQHYMDGLFPPSSALTMVTFGRDGGLRRYIETPDGLREQKIGKIFSFVRGMGISEVEFAGEWAWFRGDGCLGDIARLFSNQGFRVRGIENCIYPSKPPKNLSDEVFKGLYSEPRRFPQIVYER